MRSTWQAVLLFLIINHSNVVYLFPTSGGNGTIVRGNGDVPKELLPEPKDDHLPLGDSEGAIQDLDFDITLDQLKECPDFDPGPLEDPENATNFTKRAGRKFSTSILRKTTINGMIIISSCLTTSVALNRCLI